MSPDWGPADLFKQHLRQHPWHATSIVLVITIPSSKLMIMLTPDETKNPQKAVSCPKVVR